MKLKLKDIAEYGGGKLYGNGDVEVTGFFTDSRQAYRGGMFIPIRGERVDGHKFIPNIFEAGCEATFSEMELESGNYVLVDNNRAAFQKAAAAYRQQFDIPVVGITGSVGKTTTKEFVSLALESQLKVLKTAGNANSQVGLPITVFRIEPEHECAVLELGMSMPGEMERISAVAKVNMALITNIGVSHIEFHGTKENILAQKIHIADYVPEDGVILANGDDELLAPLKDKDSRVRLFGIGDNCDYRAENVESFTDRSEFTYKGEKVIVPAPGIHNVRNALAAIAAAEVLGLDIKKAIAAIGTYLPQERRQQIKTFGKITVIDDSYNASPDSVISALRILGNYKSRKIAVLADMLELGDYSEKGHRDVGKEAKKQADFLIAVGKFAKYIHEEFGDAENSRYFETKDEANSFLETLIEDGDTVLVKGSNSTGISQVVNHLKERYE